MRESKTPTIIRVSTCGQLSVETESHLPSLSIGVHPPELTLALYGAEEASLLHKRTRVTLTKGELSREPRQAASLLSFQFQFKPDPEIFDRDVSYYPFRVRLQELAALNPGKTIKCEYMGFPPLIFKAKSIGCLLGMMHSKSPEATKTEHFTSPNVSASFFFDESPMEKMKVFVEGVEVVDHPLDEKIRTRLRELGLPTLRQEAENVAASRASYFGVYSLETSREKDSRSKEIHTVPGFVGVFDLTKETEEEEMRKLCSTIYKLAIMRPCF